METHQVHYLYNNKEECCQEHFWWRMDQCMANEEFKFYRKGDPETPVVELLVNATGRCHIRGAYDNGFRCPGLDKMLGRLLKAHKRRKSE